MSITPDTGEHLAAMLPGICNVCAGEGVLKVGATSSRARAFSAGRSSCGAAAANAGTWFIDGGSTAAVTCTRLVAESTSFLCEPYPKDWYRFTLEREAAEQYRPSIARNSPR